MRMHEGQVEVYDDMLCLRRSLVLDAESRMLFAI